MSPDVVPTPAPGPRLRLHPKLLLASLMMAAIMLPVGLVLSGLGIAILKLAGGAAHDTSLVVVVAAYGVTDVWGGGLVRTLTRLDERSVAVAWVLARIVLLVLLSIPMHGLLTLLPWQVMVAVVAAWAGARVARAQAELRATERTRAEVAERRSVRRAAVGM